MAIDTVRGEDDSVLSAGQPGGEPMESFSYDDDVVRKFATATIVWGLVATVVGLVAALLLVLPTLFGEKIVLRILDPSSAKLGIDALGYEDHQKQLYQKHLSKPYGMILVTGPTGSGKTVSLYTGLNILNTEDRNISTAEDPAEINLPDLLDTTPSRRDRFAFVVHKRHPHVPLADTRVSVAAVRPVEHFGQGPLPCRQRADRLGVVEVADPFVVEFSARAQYLFCLRQRKLPNQAAIAVT